MSGVYGVDGKRSVCLIAISIFAVLGASCSLSASFRRLLRINEPVDGHCLYIYIYVHITDSKSVAAEILVVVEGLDLGAVG